MKVSDVQIEQLQWCLNRIPKAVKASEGEQVIPQDPREVDNHWTSLGEVTDVLSPVGVIENPGKSSCYLPSTETHFLLVLVYSPSPGPSWNIVQKSSTLSEVIPCPSMRSKWHLPLFINLVKTLIREDTKEVKTGPMLLPVIQWSSLPEPTMGVATPAREVIWMQLFLKRTSFPSQWPNRDTTLQHIFSVAWFILVWILQFPVIQRCLNIFAKSSMVYKPAKCGWSLKYNRTCSRLVGKMWKRCIQDRQVWVLPEGEPKVSLPSPDSPSNWLKVLIPSLEFEKKEMANRNVKEESLKGSKAGQKQGES